MRSSSQNLWKLACASLCLAATPLFAADPPPDSDPARWDKEIAAFHEAAKTNPPAPGGWLFTGSSSVRLWKTLADDFPELKPVNRGFGGSHTSDLAALAGQVISPCAPSNIVIYEGDNDIASNKAPERVANDFKQLAAIIHAEFPDARVHYLAIKASPSRWKLETQIRRANQLVADYCRQTPGLVYIDTFTPLLNASGEPDPKWFVDDLLHLNPDGYRLWTSVVRRKLGLPPQPAN